MDILSGFQLEKPQVLVGWGISEEQLQELFRGSELRRVKDGYFFIRCTALCGLSHNVGFRFIPRINGSLVAFELAGNGCGSLEDSYREFQNHLETTFGRPTDTSLGAEGFPTNIWHIEDIQIIHAVQEHFGPAEQLRITKRAGGPR
jgi:hypothetical protein